MPSLKFYRVWAAVLLVVIGMQATVQDAPVIEQVHGSAFSVGTFEVAIDAQAADPAQRLVVAPLPATWTSLWAHAPVAPVLALAGLAATRPDSTGPPLRDIHSWSPAPRAPPRA